MKQVDYYLRRIRAVGARPVMIWAGIECDDHSAWWELFAVFEEPERQSSGARAWEDHCGANHEDEVNGKVHVWVQDVADRRYGALLVEMPPGNIELREDSLYCNYPPGYKRDLDGADRAASMELGAALAVAIGVPFEIEPPDRGYLTWRDVLVEAAAEAGDARMQDELGCKLVNGPEKDYASALAWFHKAAAQGHASAEFNIGTLYSTGRGVTKDDGAATQWYRSAAEKGLSLAEFNMGVAHWNGYGVPTDKAEALRWYLKSAKQGYAEAQLIVAHMYHAGDGVTQDDGEALRWYQKAAELSAEGQFNLGVVHERGEGVAVDHVEAARWFLKAAESGYAKAQFNLAILYETGRGVVQDVGMAVRWYRRAARQGHRRAKERLAALTPP